MSNDNDPIGRSADDAYRPEDFPEPDKVAEMTKERDDLRAEVERLTKLTSGMEDYAVLQRSVQTDHLALLAEAEAALEKIKPGYGLDLTDDLQQRADYWARECLGFHLIARETLARLREKKGGA